MARCAAVKPDGTPCVRIVDASQKYCYAHDTRHQEARSRAASKAARSKPRRELQALRKQASKLYDEVHSGEVEPKAGAVLTQITNTQARILELERKLKETEELEERLEALEQAQHQKAGNRWRA
jgi:hypothetical protein